MASSERYRLLQWECQRAIDSCNVIADVANCFLGLRKSNLGSIVGLELPIDVAVGVRGEVRGFTLTLLHTVTEGLPIKSRVPNVVTLRINAGQLETIHLEKGRFLELIVLRWRTHDGHTVTSKTLNKDGGGREASSSGRIALPTLSSRTFKFSLSN